MSLFGRQILAILEKSLDLTTQLLAGLAKGNDSASHAGSRDGLYRPSPSTYSSITSNPLIPACLLLVLGFLVLYSSPVKTWLTETEGLPTLAEIFSFSRKHGPPVLPEEGERVSVWARTQSGFYYCQGGTLFDSQPGTMMAQVDALTSGYRPFGGEYCAGGQQIDAASGSPPFENQQQPEQASISAPQENVLDQSLAKPSDISNAGAGISVWAIKEFGYYYCQGQILFGNSRGKLMSQSDALSAGYRPSVSRCTNGQPNGALTGNLPIGAQQPGGARTVSTPGVESLAVLSNKPDASKTEGGVQVWVKSEYGFYYCRNDVLFGNRPGQLMTEASALTAGYQPSDGRCTDDKPPRTTAERLPGH